MKRQLIKASNGSISIIMHNSRNSCSSLQGIRAQVWGSALLNLQPMRVHR